MAAGLGGTIDNRGDFHVAGMTMVLQIVLGNVLQFDVHELNCRLPLFDSYGCTEVVVPNVGRSKLAVLL